MTKQMSALQLLVDRLAAEIELPALIDDRHLRPLAYSAHVAPEGLDAVRMESLVGRHARPEVEAYLSTAGIAEADAPLLVAGDDELGLGARWCVPIRHRANLLGYLWVMAVDGIDAAVLQRYAVSAAMALSGREESEASSHSRLRRLLSSDVADAADAAAELLGRSLAGTRDQLAVLTVEFAAPVDGEEMPVALAVGLRELTRRAGRRTVLHAVLGDHAAVLISHDAADGLQRRGREVAEELRGTVSAAGGAPAVVGVGGAAGTLTAARRSYEQARWAARVASRLEGSPPVSHWDELGIFQLLSRMIVEETAEIPGPLLGLLESASSDMLVQTLEVYLDSGGDAQQASSRLHLARGSLYYRLHRIEEVAGVDLRSGEDRLLLHLGLKLARLLGLWRGGSYVPARAELAG